MAKIIITEAKVDSIISELKKNRNEYWKDIYYELQDDAEFLFIRIYIDEQIPIKVLSAPGKIEYLDLDFKIPIKVFSAPGIHIATKILSEAIPEREDGQVYSWMVDFLYKGDSIGVTMGGGSNGVVEA